MSKVKKNNQPKKILIVEDDNFLREMYKTKLLSEGFNVTVAEDGEKGLKVILARDFDLILLDIIMPKKDGLEVLEAIKNNPDKKNIPVVVLTNLSEKEHIKKGMSLGAKDYIIKAHFVPSEVVEKVNQIIELLG